ncbi:bifunctional nuclease family protein [Desulfovibrio sp. ZJ200]|uniref:bifunctional nuclease family protein n=1 Tax=Desulfovibrio sp. ZJ200 TaxID=2709792 RepID=UPI0013EDE821|nr:bifunctional nuclease family protein [Desulfovibrio sp. ZJ200]
MVEMRVLGLTIDPQTKTPIVILGESGGDTLLPIWVGAMEAMTVSLVLNNENLPRPLTHDLLLMSFKALKTELPRVEITELKDGVYYALLILNGPEGVIRVDCRPSDAIALALRAKARILVNEEVLRRSAEAQDRVSRRMSDKSLPIPAADAATDMMRKAGAQKEIDRLSGVLTREGVLPQGNAREEEERLRELLRSLDPISRRKM